MTAFLPRPRAGLLAALVIVAGIAAFASVAATTSNGSPGRKAAAKPLRLADATMIIEVNSTDGDAGLQVFLDGEPWSEMAVFAPDRRKVLDVDATGRLNRFGLTELFSESHEPEFSELPLAKFKRRFPAGRYRFRGRTVEGRRLVGSARFSHDTPAGPEITSPAAGATVPEAGLVARWNRGSQPAGVEIAGYRVIVEREEPLRVFNADLPASATSVTIPAEFLEPSTEYKLEVQAIETSGNQTISELTFKVS
jgi:fibronectin type III domain protein